MRFAGFELGVEVGRELEIVAEEGVGLTRGCEVLAEIDGEECLACACVPPDEAAVVVFEAFEDGLLGLGEGDELAVEVADAGADAELEVEMGSEELGDCVGLGPVRGIEAGLVCPVLGQTLDVRLHIVYVVTVADLGFGEVGGSGVGIGGRGIVPGDVRESYTETQASCVEMVFSVLVLLDVFHEGEHG